MYPTISDAIYGIFGVYIPLPVQTFGFFMALSFIVAAWLLIKELKRKENLGIISSQTKKIIVGKPATAQEIVIMAIVGFILGFKLIGIILHYNSFSDNPQTYIFSSDGSLIGGILFAALAAYLRFWEKNKHKLDKPREEEIVVHPYELTGNIILYGALFGIIGSKIFDNLENFDKFMEDPMGSLFSFSGLTFYGGLICAAIAIMLYAKKNKISPLVISDIAAPAIMIAYAVGRIGCQAAGDGDWGVLNSAYITMPNTKVELAQGTQFQDTLKKYETFYLSEFDVQNLNKVPRLNVKGPAWLPHWLIAYSYPHNVIRSGIEIPLKRNQVEPRHNNQLPIPVFPTPIYETLMCAILFFILWILRKRMKTTGVMFSVFLIMNGVERFFIEKIRVNVKYHIFGYRITQAEIISTMLIIAGVVLLVIVMNKKRKTIKIDSSRSLS